MVRVSRRDTLDRYYLLKLFGFGLFLHKIKQSDPVDTLHSHPWNWISFIFGSYTEHRLGEKRTVRRFVNSIKGEVPHRVELTQGPVWTILFHGRRCNEWGVFDLEGNLLDTEPWRGVGGRTSYRPDE